MNRSSPSPFRRSTTTASPDRGYLSSYLADHRNSEDNHRDALLAAQEEHTRVREKALQVFKLHELEAERKRIEEEEIAEQKRIAAERAIAEEQRKLNELRRTTIPKPPPVQPTPEPAKPAVQEAPKPTPQPTAPVPPAQPAPTIKSEATPEPPPNPPGAPAAAQTTTVQSPAITAPRPPSTTASPPASAPAVNGFKPATETAKRDTQAQINARYLQIHKELKTLRANLRKASKQPGTPLKQHFGDMRREISKSVGQLTATGIRGANKQQNDTIVRILRQSLDGSVPSPDIDVQQFVLDPRQPEEGAVHNGNTLPSLFIFLLNIFSKAICRQFTSEAAVNTKSADPIGVSAALVFSDKSFHWRGKTLVDILICKYRVVCPVLFGLRGSEKTEQGRERLGWRREEGVWVEERVHRDRMTGLGAGFGAISLRHFNKADLKNPFPPTNYWKALAFIVNTPQAEITNTHYIVLRAMIENNEQRFLKFYGNAGLAALRMALIEFPRKAPAGVTEAESVKGLAALLADEGLNWS